MAGVGTIGTQVLIYGMVSNYYRRPRRAPQAWRGAPGSAASAASSARSSAECWSAPASARLTFYIFAGVALIGMAVTFLVPHARHGASKADLAPQAEAVVTR